MIKALKALSALLTYPTAELQQAAGEISEAIENEPAITFAVRDQLHRLLKELAADDLYDLQERYVLLFDRTRSLSLHLFEHVHGESRDRGQAMVDLKAQYVTAGLEQDTPELPDFLPLFLEYASTLPAAQARDALAQPAHIFAAMAERLRKRRSAYEAVFRALVASRTATTRSRRTSSARRIRSGASSSTRHTDNLLMLTLSRGGPIVWISEIHVEGRHRLDNDWIEAFSPNGALVACAVVSQRVKQGTDDDGCAGEDRERAGLRDDRSARRHP